jgi:hypothetical protein
MTATTAFLCRMTLSLVSITIATESQIRTVSGSEGVSASDGSQEPGTLAMPRKTDPNATVRMPSAGKPKQIPMAPDRTQAVEEWLRSGQMEKAIAQGEISDRLNQLYSGSNRVTGETAAEHSAR